MWAHGLSLFDAQVLACCLMGNHYHFVLCTRSAKLSRLMRHINGVYTQTYNRRHSKVVHLFQGRFKAKLNSVRAKMVPSPDAWPWSSYRAHVGQAPAPPWLDTAGLHGYLLGHELVTQTDQQLAAKRYMQQVADGQGVKPVGPGLEQTD